MSLWRQRYLRNRITALEIIIADKNRAIPLKLAKRERRLAFKDLIYIQLEDYNKEMIK